MPNPRKLTPEEKAAFTRQEQEQRQSLAGGMTPYQDPLMLSGMPDPVGPPEGWESRTPRYSARVAAGDYEGAYALLAENSRRQSPESRVASMEMHAGAYPKLGEKRGTREENLERVRRDYLEKMMQTQGDWRPTLSRQSGLERMDSWGNINYPSFDMKPRQGLWAEDPMKYLPAMLRRQGGPPFLREQEQPRGRRGRVQQQPSRQPRGGPRRQQQPRPSDAEFLKMWEGRNQVLQQQRGREGERREFEKGRPMLPSGASDIQRPTGPLRPERAPPRPQQRFEGGDLGRPMPRQETNLPGEGVYDWEQRVQQAEDALQNAIRAAGG